MIFSGSGCIRFFKSSGSRKNTLLSIKKKNQPTVITFKGTFNFNFCEIKAKRIKILIICLLFHFCLDPDPKQIIPDLDPQYRFYLLRLLGSVLNFDSIHQRNNIHFHRTDGRVPFYLCPLWGRADILNQSASLPPPPPYSRSGSAPSPGGTEKGGARIYNIPPPLD